MALLAVFARCQDIIAVILVIQLYTSLLDELVLGLRAAGIEEAGADEGAIRGGVGEEIEVEAEGAGGLQGIDALGGDAGDGLHLKAQGSASIVTEGDKLPRFGSGEQSGVGGAIGYADDIGGGGIGQPACLRWVAVELPFRAGLQGCFDGKAGVAELQADGRRYQRRAAWAGRGAGRCWCGTG